MPGSKRLLAGLGVLIIAAALAGCGGDDRPRIVVAGAADLRFAFEELEEPFEAICDCDVVFSFGSSGLLSTQIEQGLGVDVFASADTAYVDSLIAKGLVLDGTAQLYAIGRIVLAVSVRARVLPTELGDLRGPQFREIAIANPEHAPYGIAAKQALQSEGIWEEVEERLVLGENASLATQFVETGNADAGVVPLSLAIQRPEVLRYTLIDASLHEPLRQVAAVIRSSKNSEEAIAFLDFVNGEQGREVMRKYGFVLPGEESQ